MELEELGAHFGAKYRSKVLHWFNLLHLSDNMLLTQKVQVADDERLESCLVLFTVIILALQDEQEKVENLLNGELSTEAAINLTRKIDSLLIPNL